MVLFGHAYIHYRQMKTHRLASHGSAPASELSLTQAVQHWDGLPDPVC